MKTTEEILSNCPDGCNAEDFHLGYLVGQSDLVVENLTNIINQKPAIDWLSSRREIAKDILCHIYNPVWEMEPQVAEAIEVADELIKQLTEEKK